MLVSVLRQDRAAGAANHCADGRAFATAGNGADDRSEGCADRALSNGRVGAVPIGHVARGIDPQGHPAGCAHGIEDRIERGRLAVAQVNRVEVDLHIRVAALAVRRDPRDDPVVE